MNRTRPRQVRVLMLVENNPYPQDPRVRNEALALTRAGYQVTVIAPAKRGQPRTEEVEGVAVLRYPAPPEVSGAVGYLLEYSYSTLVMLALALAVAFGRGFDVLHAHNPPDTLVLIGALFRPFGKRFVFDVHDLSPEMYRARFPESSGKLVVPLLGLLERASFAVADQVIVTNESYAAVASGRGGVARGRISVVRNGPDLARVRVTEQDASLRERAANLIGYVGVMGTQDGVDYLLRALAHLKGDLGLDDFLAVIVGRGDALPGLEALTRELGLGEHVWFTGYVPDEQLMSILSTVDVFAAPEPSNPFNDKSTMIKLTEYLVFGAPIVAFDLPEHRVTAGDAALYAKPNDELDFARQLERALTDPDVRARSTRAAAERLPRLVWDRQAPALLEAYGRLDVGARASTVDG